jgi:hypothetical protein
MVARNSALSRLNVSSQFAPVHAVPISNSSRATHKQCEGAPLPTGYPDVPAAVKAFRRFVESTEARLSSGFSIIHGHA